MSEVRYAQYREYFEQRVAANNAIMAFLAGSQLAGHTLTLVEGSDLLLPQVFPNVPHISRFNLRADLAKDVLASAEGHLGYMAVPYVLAIHEDYVVTGALDLLVGSGHISRARQTSSKMSNMHENLKQATGSVYTPGFLPLFHLLRLMRNSLIHAGRRASPALESTSHGLDSTTVALWRRLAGSPPPLITSGDEVSMRHAEIVVALAVTKRLARDANDALASTVPRDMWADMVVEDAIHARNNLGNPRQVMRLLRGLARHHYALLKLTETDLSDAARRAGLLP